MENNEEFENLVKLIQKKTGLKEEFALHLAKQINELDKNKEYNSFSLKKKISTALNKLFNQAT